MIFYFTGTGNSYHVAKELQEATEERLISIAEAVKKKQYEYKASTKERIGFVFPVYYWGLPTIVEEFVKRLQIKHGKGNFVYTVVTCGASIGMTMRRMEKLLHKKGLSLDSGYSIRYPDNYIILYDVPTKEEQEQQLTDAAPVLEDIREEIVTRKKGILRITRGKAPHLLSGILHFYYRKNRKTTSFYANADCTGCGLCSRICPTGCITMKEISPEWGKECTQCLGCINRCPTAAIQYGRKTEKRSRYVHPDLLKESGVR